MFALKEKNGMKDEQQSETVTDEVLPPNASLSTSAVVRIVLTVLLILIIAIAAGFLVYWLSGLILLIVLAIFFAYLVSPLVNLVQKPFSNGENVRWMPRPLAIGIVYLFIFSGLWAATAYLLPIVNEQAVQLIQQAPSYAQTFRERYEEVEKRYRRLALPPELRGEIEKNLTEFGANISRTATEEIGKRLLGSVTLLPYLILIPVLGFFFLKDAPLFHLMMVRAFPRGRLRGRAELFLQDVNKTLRAYMRAQLISCFLIGTICTVVFSLLGVRYALLLGLLAGLLEFIPLVGPLTIGILAALLASFYSFNQAIWVVIFLLVLRVTHDYVTYPRIVREGIHLHPLAIILAILGGGEVAGATGIFLAIPVVAIATVSYRHLMEHRGSQGIVFDLLDAGKTDKAVQIAEKKLEQIGSAAKKQRDVEEKTQSTPRAEI